METVLDGWITVLALLFAGIIGLILVIQAANRGESYHRISEAIPIIVDPSTSTQVSCPCISDPAEKYMSLIIPAFNEELRLPATLNATFDYLEIRASKDYTFTYEVVIVDDGSSDATVRVAYHFIKQYSLDKIRVIELDRNHGKGEAIRKGMLHSRGELLLMLDADGATDVSDLEKLENEIRTFAGKNSRSAAHNSGSRLSDSLVAVFGSRAHLKQNALATRRWYRNFLMRGFQLVVLMAVGPGIRDTQCGFKMFTRAAAQKLFSTIRLKRWCFDVELVYLCNLFHIPMVEMSVNGSEVPGSKFSWLSIPHMLWELALMYVGYGTCMWISTKA